MGYHATLPITTGHNSSENDIISSSSVPVAPQPGKYFLSTGKDFPFCRKFDFSLGALIHWSLIYFPLLSFPERHYRFTIELAKPRSAEPWVQGSLSAAIFSDKGALRNIELTPKGTARLEHGSSYQVVITNPHDLGDKIRKVRNMSYFIHF